MASSSGPGRPDGSAPRAGSSRSTTISENRRCRTSSTRSRGTFIPAPCKSARFIAWRRVSLPARCG